MVERILDYGSAINEAIFLMMQNDKNVVVYGQGVDDPKRINGSTNNLVELFGKERIFDVPLSEDAMTGIGIGMAVGGLIPINTHIRMDFNLLTMNQLINMAAKLKYTHDGVLDCPFIVRTIIGKSWGQGPQHSQSLYPMFMNIPGITVVAPTTPYDAKGLLIESIKSRKVVLFIEHRMLYYQKGHVPEEIYSVPFNRSRLLTNFSYADVTLVGVSQMSVECLRASKLLETHDIFADVIDLMNLNPLDRQIEEIEQSVAMTKRLIVVDCAWKNCGAGAEIIARLKERNVINFEATRMSFAECPCPTTPSLEDEFYPNALKIAKEAHRKIFGNKNKGQIDFMEKEYKNMNKEEIVFKGPF